MRNNFKLTTLANLWEKTKSSLNGAHHVFLLHNISGLDTEYLDSWTLFGKYIPAKDNEN